MIQNRASVRATDSPARSDVLHPTLLAAQFRPAVFQSLFVTMYAGLWILGWVPVPGIGRPEKLVALLGILVVPVAVGVRKRLPPAAISIGLAGLLGTYALSYAMNSPTPEGTDFVVSLAARIVFLWVSFILLQNTIALNRAVWLLISSSLVSAVVALVVMTFYGIGVGRLDPLGLQASLDPFTFSTFASAQLATMGAILLLGASGDMESKARRIAATICSFIIFAAAYACYFRREQLLSIPFVILTLVLTGRQLAGRRARVAAVVAVVGFVGIVVWDFSREDSILKMRVESEFGGSFVDPVETRLTNMRAELLAVAERPMLGFGAGKHTEAISRFALPGERFLAGFNTLGWLAVEGGLPCALFYGVVLFGTGRIVWKFRSLRSPGPQMLILRCGPALVLQIVLWGIFGNAWDLPLGWFVLAMILASAQIVQARPAAGTVLRPSVPINKDLRTWARQ